MGVAAQPCPAHHTVSLVGATRNNLLLACSLPWFACLSVCTTDWSSVMYHSLVMATECMHQAFDVGSQGDQNLQAFEEAGLFPGDSQELSKLRMP